jgi:hypothetical protein
MISRSPDHRYTDEHGVEYVGVTSCLRMLQDSSWWTDEARIRGTHAHAAVVLDLEGDLGEMPDADWWPRVEAARRFRSENEAVTEASEVMVSDPALRLAGTIDWIGTINGAPSIVDWKPASDNHVTGLQLAAYAHMQFLADKVVRQRLSVHLHDDGTYRIQQHTDRQDWPTFRALLTIESWKRAHGI